MNTEGSEGKQIEVNEANYMAELLKKVYENVKQSDYTLVAVKDGQRYINFVILLSFFFPNIFRNFHCDFG